MQVMQFLQPRPSVRFEATFIIPNKSTFLRYQPKYICIKIS